MLDKLPHEINDIILSYLISSIISINIVKNNNKELLTFLLLSKEKTTYNKLQKNNKIYYFLNKYNVFQKEYSYSYYHGFDENIIFTNPILCDILFTELNIPFSRSSFNRITDNLFEDLKEIIRLIPDSLESGWCHLRCRTNVTPLYAACINEKIPLDIVKYMIEQGADKKNKVKVNGFSRNILVDIRKETVNIYRYNRLVELFDEQVNNI
tara:strand:+ start:560 stop:1189 length:630 start_codon:yes stop_codon:yes gene_type:complete